MAPAMDRVEPEVEDQYTEEPRHAERQPAKTTRGGSGRGIERPVKRERALPDEEVGRVVGPVCAEVALVLVPRAMERQEPLEHDDDGRVPEHQRGGCQEICVSGFRG